MIYLLIGFGGIIGSLFRYFLSIVSIKWWGTSFPLGTLFINLSGAFLLGWLSSGWMISKKFHPYVLTAFSTGVIGSYTTFSTFCLDAITLIEQGKYLSSILYILASLFGGVLFVNIGMVIGGKKLKQERKIS